ncbi:hypothetical protein ACS0TY_033593 [Phlomoides rotata]
MKKLPKNLEFQFNFSVSGYEQKDRIILIAQPFIDTPGGSTNPFLDMGKKTKPYLSPNRPSTPQEEAQTVGALREVSNKSHNAKLKFLEVECGPVSSCILDDFVSLLYSCASSLALNYLFCAF